MTYNRFIQGLRLAGVEVDRKVLADLAVTDPAAFTALVEVARAAVVAEGTGGAASRRPPEPGYRPAQRHATPGSSPRAGSPDGRGGARPGVSLPKARRRCARPSPPMR